MRLTREEHAEIEDALARILDALDAGVRADRISERRYSKRVVPVARALREALWDGADSETLELLRGHRQSDDFPDLGSEYYVLSSLGGGGFGRVYLAVHTILWRFHAIKVALHSPNPRLAEDLLRGEARIPARIRELSHPNLVKIITAANDPLRLVMEYVPGGSLQNGLERGMDLSRGRAVEISANIAQGLRVLHSGNLVHGDIKPGNVLLHVDGHAILTDLGFTRRMDDARATVGFAEGYAAPEIYLENGDPRRIGQPSDIYSLAATYYRLQTGRVPVQPPDLPDETSCDEVQERLRRGQPPCDSIPQGLRDFVARCLSYDQALRPTIHEFCAAFEGDPEVSESWSRATRPRPERIVEEQEQRGRPLRLGSPDFRLVTDQLPPIFADGVTEYRARLACAGGRPPYEWKVEGLPLGLSVESPDESVAWITGRLAPDASQPREALDLRISVSEGRGGEARWPWAIPVAVLRPDEYCIIPAGPAKLGYHRSPERDLALNRMVGADPEALPAADVGREFPPRTLALPRFAIKRTPVTNAEYAAFVTDHGHPAPPHWKSDAESVGRRERDRPVVDVTFEDAVAYCRWRGTRLPSESRWERAARGEDAALFPWGDDFDEELCNTRESGRRGLSRVQDHEDGASPEGVLDMAGNAAEWVDGGSVESDAHGIVVIYRFTRGGSYRNRSFRALSFTRSRERFAERVAFDPTGRAMRVQAPHKPWIGFRDVVELDPESTRQQELVLVLGGKFRFGPSGQVRRIGNFRMARFAVSNAEYFSFVVATGHPRPPHWASDDPPFPWEDRHHPVVNVSQADAEAFCDWRHQMTGLRHRLPSRMQWERAVRGRISDPTEGPYAWGREFEAWRCNTPLSGLGRAVAVTDLPEGCTPEGLYNLCGNVFEWLSREGECRGGSWRFRDPESACRAWTAVRNPNEFDGDTGFRYVTGAGESES